MTETAPSYPDGFIVMDGVRYDIPPGKTLIISHSTPPYLVPFTGALIQVHRSGGHAVKPPSTIERR